MGLSHRRILRVTQRVELPMSQLALPQEGLSAVGQVSADDRVLVLCGGGLELLEDYHEEVALEVLHLLLRLLHHVLGVHLEHLGGIELDFGLGLRVVLRRRNGAHRREAWWFGRWVDGVGGMG